MSSKLKNILTALILVIAVIAAVLFIGIFFAEGEESLYAKVDPLVEFSAWLFYITLAITLIFTILNMFKQPEDLKKILLNLGLLTIVFFAAYFTASDAAVLDVQGQVLEDGEAGMVSKIISTIINFSVYLGVIAIVAVAFDTVRTAIK